MGKFLKAKVFILTLVVQLSASVCFMSGLAKIPAMSSSKEDALSPDELRKRLYQTFKSKGVLDTLKVSNVNNGAVIIIHCCEKVFSFLDFFHITMEDL